MASVLSSRIFLNSSWVPAGTSWVLPCVFEALPGFAWRSWALPGHFLGSSRRCLGSSGLFWLLLELFQALLGVFRVLLGLCRARLRLFWAVHELFAISFGFFCALPGLFKALLGSSWVFLDLLGPSELFRIVPGPFRLFRVIRGLFFLGSSVLFPISPMLFQASSGLCNASAHFLGLPAHTLLGSCRPWLGPSVLFVCSSDSSCDLPGFFLSFSWAPSVCWALPGFLLSFWPVLASSGLFLCSGGAFLDFPGIFLDFVPGSAWTLPDVSKTFPGSPRALARSSWLFLYC